MRRRASFACVALTAAIVAAAPASAGALTPPNATPHEAQVSAKAGTAQRAGASTVRRDAQPNLSSTPSPIWQTNGTVWALAVSSGVLYVGGSFTSVRPPGSAPGNGEVARSYLAAFDATTGDLLPFAPTLDGQVQSLAVSPDGSTLYVGGAFQHADGVYRLNLAAFSTSTGNLSSTWAPQASGPVSSIAVSPDGSTIYMGGGFMKINGQARAYAGAVDSSGNLLPWAPAVNGVVKTIAVAPDDSRVLLGGYFSAINGVYQQAIGSTDPATGVSDPWAATIEPNEQGCVAAVKDIVISGSIAYVASEGTGGGCFDGDFAANVSDGTLQWQSDCLGATQAVEVVGNWLYKASHAHDCAFAPEGFPQVANPAGGWVLHHLLDQSLTDGSLGHWTPDCNQPNSDEPLGGGVMTTDGTQLFIGGDFTTVNGQPQQGLTRFGPGPASTPPGSPGAPTVVSTAAGVDSVSFTGVSSPDVGSLTYSIYRDGGTTPVGTLTATSWPWALPYLHFRDSGLTPGTQHTYTVSVSDGTNTSAMSPASAPVVVASSNPPASYVQTVLSSQPSAMWQLDETSGNTAYDSSTHGYNGTYEPGTTLGLAGAISGTGATAAGFDGHKGFVTANTSSLTTPYFSIEVWFETTTDTGGFIAGFCNQRIAMTSACNRNLYMMNDGQVAFGVWNKKAIGVISPAAYNDGQWHFAVATLGSGGMSLYVDGQLVGTNSNTIASQYKGYWRLGGASLTGWSLDYWGKNSQGTTEPNSFFLPGEIGDFAAYSSALSASTVAQHYAANYLSH